jgi:MFS family permease
LQKQLQLNDVALGTLLSVLPLGLMTAMPFAGISMAKYSSRKIMLVSAIIYTLLLLLLGNVHTWWQAAIVLFMFGFARTFFNIAVNTQALGVQAFFQKSIITTLHGIWSLAALFGAAVSLLFMSIDASVQIHFIVVSICSLVLIGLFYKTTLVANNTSAEKRKAFAMPDKSLLLLGSIAFLCMMCEGTMSDWSGIYFEKVVHMPERYIATGYIVYLTAMVTGRFIGDYIINRMGRIKLLQITSVLVLSGFLLAVAFPNPFIASLGFLLIGFGVSCTVPMVFALAAATSKLPHGTAIAAVSTVGYIGFLLGPPIVGYFSGIATLRVAFLVIGITASIIFILARIVARKTLTVNA